MNTHDLAKAYSVNSSDVDGTCPSLSTPRGQISGGPGDGPGYLAAMTGLLRLASRLVPISAAALVFCVAPPTAARADAAPHFDPIAFFTGETEGRGRLKVMASHGKAMHVAGHGAVEADGDLVLDQTVTTAGEQAKTRRWRIRRIAPDRYAGTLTDAAGPVRLAVIGDRLRIRYRAKGGLAFAQVLTLAPGGQTARNVMKVRKLGIVVATLHETIERR